MNHYRRLLFAVAILLSGVALIPYVSLSSKPIGWQMFADVYEPDQPTLVVNYKTGRPGSYFTLTGTDFPPDDTATISVNRNAVGNVPTDGDGKLEFLLNTSSSDEGFYRITSAVNPTASAGFLLDSQAPLRPQEGTGAVFDVPSGIALTEFVYLPIVLR